jgi:hypothetical protein
MMTNEWRRSLSTAGERNDSTTETTRRDRMTDRALQDGALNDAELDTVSGGGGALGGVIR